MSRNSGRLRNLFATGTFTALMLSGAEAAPQGRLLLPGPFSTSGPTFNEIHEYCLATRGRRTLATFPSLPFAADVCPDGYLYVADKTNVSKLNRLTGQVISSFAHQTSSPVTLACKPNGNLLMAPNNGSTIDEYTPTGTRSAWASAGLSTTIRNIRLTPQGTIAFLDRHPGLELPNKLVEYDLAGNHLRDVLTSSDGMTSFVFPTVSEILVSHSVSRCIKRYDWTTTPASFTSNFVCDSARISSTLLALHPTDGSVYGSDHVSACIHVWNPDGTLQYGGQPLGCYDPLLYAGVPIVLAEDPLVCIPTLSEWGMMAMRG